jgi:hypothetical protein
MDERSEEVDERPWELPGAMRRDCLPHRGGLLCNLTGASTLLAMLVGPLGLVLGVIVWASARHDIAQIRQGSMDTSGEAKTIDARDGAVLSILFALSATVFWTWLLLTQPGSCKFQLFF